MPQSKRTLIVGATPNADRYAYKATQMLVDHGIEVIPFGIKKGKIGELSIVNEWPQGANVHTVTLYINAGLQLDYMDQIFELKPARIIFNPGTENSELKKKAESQKIETLDACTLVLLRTNQY